MGTTTLFQSLGRRRQSLAKVGSSGSSKNLGPFAGDALRRPPPTKVSSSKDLGLLVEDVPLRQDRVEGLRGGARRH
jgi:hypothetical protein